MTRIRQKADRLTEDFRRRFTGEFYTPVEFAAKGLAYLERTVGREWWKSGEYRFWDMAAGTGNLEFELPSSALPYCYISTLDREDSDYCRKIFPAATCFQYDYLADDIPALAGQMTFGQTRKMPPNLVADLANQDIKWIGGRGRFRTTSIRSRWRKCVAGHAPTATSPRSLPPRTKTASSRNGCRRAKTGNTTPCPAGTPCAHSTAHASSARTQSPPWKTKTRRCSATWPAGFKRHAAASAGSAE